MLPNLNFIRIAGDTGTFRFQHTWVILAVSSCNKFPVDTLVLKGFRPYWSDARPYKPYYTEAQMDEMVEMYLNGELELVASDEDDEIMEMP